MYATKNTSTQDMKFVYQDGYGFICILELQVTITIGLSLSVCLSLDSTTIGQMMEKVDKW